MVWPLIVVLGLQHSCFVVVDAVLATYVTLPSANVIDTVPSAPVVKATTG